MTDRRVPSCVSAHALQLAHRMAEVLSRELTASCQVWANSHGWTQLKELNATDIDATLSWSEDAAQAYLQREGQRTEPALLDTYEGGSLAIVPIIQAGLPSGTLVVIGLIGEPASRPLSRLLSAIVRNVSQEQAHEEALSKIRGYVRQVTSDFEELTWLRGLAERMEVCGLQNDLPTVAATILPSLYELIQAEAIVLLETRPGSDAPADTEPYVVGHLPLSRAACMEVVASLRPGYRGRPMIENASSRTAHIGRWPTLHNYIAVRISKGASHFGWLLALNKACGRTAAADGLPLAGSVSNWEFGTFEGGLVNSAAIMLATHARNVELFNEKEEMLLGLVRALINAIDAKDAYTCGHSDRVASYARLIAAHMGLSNEECERIYMAGLLHDIGKIGVPDDVLCKPGKLTDEEFAQIKKHPEIGYAILKHLPQLSYLLPGVLYHHEAVDGRGYPHGLTGEAIPLYGRILAVVDAYDAMTSSRPYRSAMPTERAEAILRDGAGKQWDSRIVEAFFAALPEIQTVRSNADLRQKEGLLPGCINLAEMLPLQVPSCPAST